MYIVGRQLDLLQWSHVFSDMVRVIPERFFARFGAASMEPCLFRHGKSQGTVEFGVVSEASMEPCLFRHGKKAPRAPVEVTWYASMEPCLFRHGKRR